MHDTYNIYYIVKAWQDFPEISGIKVICKVNEWLSKVGTCMHEDRDFYFFFYSKIINCMAWPTVSWRLNKKSSVININREKSVQNVNENSV